MWGDEGGGGVDNESVEHEEIRINIFNYLKKLSLEPINSHGEDDDIHFYHISDNHPIKVHLADPDILAHKDDHYLAIEIERSLQPKHLLGVSKAISLCNNYKIGNGELRPISKLSFLLVVKNEVMNKPGSHRPKQIKLINEVIKQMPGLEFVGVIGDDKVESAIDEWRRIVG